MRNKNTFLFLLLKILINLTETYLYEITELLPTSGSVADTDSTGTPSFAVATRTLDEYCAFVN